MEPSKWNHLPRMVWVGHAGDANQPGGVWDIPCSFTAPGTTWDVEGDKWLFLSLSKDLHNARASLTPSLLSH